MTSKTLFALTFAGTCALSAGTFAGGVHHKSSEVRTPSSVSESAPALTGQPQARPSMRDADSARLEPLIIVEAREYWLIGAEPSEASASAATGASASDGASGSVGFDSTLSSSER